MSHELPAPGKPESITFAPLLVQLESLRAIGIQVDHLEIKGSRKLKYVRAVRPFWRQIQAADLIHAHFGHPGLIARLQHSKPVVISFMGSDILGAPSKDDGSIPISSRFQALFYRRFARCFDSVIVKSPEMADVLRPLQVHVVPNGVDLERFRPVAKNDARNALGWDPEKYYVLFPGNPSNPRKGFADLAKPAADHAARGVSRPIELVPLVGVSPDLVPLYMNACDVEVMTSFVEGSPNVVKEAMACNLPVFSVEVGDVPWLLEGVAASTICARDPIDLARHMIDFFLAGAGRSNGRDALRRLGLDSTSVARKIHKIYQETLSAEQQYRK